LAEGVLPFGCVFRIAARKHLQERNLHGYWSSDKRKNTPAGEYMIRKTWTRTAAVAALLVPLAAIAAPRAPQAAIAAVIGTESVAPMRLEIDISERKLYVYHGGDVETYPVAVGMPEYPTPTGDYTISQVTWNPDWRPPESEWSEDEEYMPPEDPDVPMGKVKIMWKAPDYTIHGTDAIESLGTNASHGSVRMANETAIALAKRVMAHGGVNKSAEWFEMAVRNDSDQHVVELTDPVPIDIHQ
jgi:lipoprotein-anchoring transpeptidase ErfK/SrfK